jgi:hypothetical protein
MCIILYNFFFHAHDLKPAQQFWDGNAIAPLRLAEPLKSQHPSSTHTHTHTHIHTHTHAALRLAEPLKSTFTTKLSYIYYKNITQRTFQSLPEILKSQHPSSTFTTK